MYYKLRQYDSDIHVFEFSPEELRLDVSVGTKWKLEKLSKINGEPREDEEVYAKINGGFFAMNGSTEYLGTYVDEGLYYSGSVEYYPTLIYWKDTNKFTIEHNPTQDRCSYYQDKAHFAIGVPWTLIVNGVKDFTYDKATLVKVFGHPYYKAPRTLLGQTNNGTIIWVVVDGRSDTSAGINITQSYNIMKDLDCAIAVNLDGGGSSEMIIENAIMNWPSDGSERSIGTAFLAYRKKVQSVESALPEVETSSVSTYVEITNVPDNDVLNIRNYPSTKGNIVDTTVNGHRFLVYEATSDGKWLHISNFINGEDHPCGWINAKYAKELHIKGKTDDVSILYKEKSILDTNTILKIIGEDTDFYWVIYNGELMYVLKDRVEEV